VCYGLSAAPEAGAAFVLEDVREYRKCKNKPIKLRRIKGFPEVGPRKNEPKLSNLCSRASSIEAKNKSITPSKDFGSKRDCRCVSVIIEIQKQSQMIEEFKGFPA